MEKRYNKKEFSAYVNGVSYLFAGYTTNTRTGYCETITCITHEITDSKISWCGRDWQGFDYECALKKAIGKFSKGIQGELFKQLIERKEEEINNRLSKLETSFISAYNKLTDRQREIMKDTPTMNTIEDVERVTGIMQVFGLLNSMNNE